MDSINDIMSEMVRRNASDMYLTIGSPIALRVNDTLEFLRTPALEERHIDGFFEALLGEEKRDEFEASMELNSALNWEVDGQQARFRINAFYQQQQAGMVLRRVHTNIPGFDALGLLEVYGRLVMQKRGLVLVVGQTGSGKSTSLASMVDYRNQHGTGHIITVEDPIEFIHTHKRCIITQREVGIDTYSYGMALKNALRQRPDVVLIGEIRDRETMEHAINFAETGHLCLATLHANNSYQAIERILSFMPEDKHRQTLMNLAMNLKGILCQRLIDSQKGDKALACEVLLNQGLIRELIEEGKTKEIRSMIERNQGSGMQSFDQALVALCQKGIISESMAIAESDNPQNLRLKIRQEVGHPSMMKVNLMTLQGAGDTQSSDQF